MSHYRGTTKEVIKNPFNAPIAVKWSARFEPEAEGIRTGMIRITMGKSDKSVAIRASTQGGRLSCDLGALQGVEQRDEKVGGAGSYQRLDLSAAPQFAKAFLGAIKARFEQEWSRLQGSLRPDGNRLIGGGNIVITPGEWGQNHDEVVNVPYARMVSVATGGMNKRY